MVFDDPISEPISATTDPELSTDSSEPIFVTRESDIPIVYDEPKTKPKSETDGPSRDIFTEEEATEQFPDLLFKGKYYRGRRVYEGNQGGLYTLSKKRNGEAKKSLVPVGDRDTLTDEPVAPVRKGRIVPETVNKKINEIELEDPPKEVEPPTGESFLTTVSEFIYDSTMVVNNLFIAPIKYFQYSTSAIVNRKEVLVRLWKEYLISRGWDEDETIASPGTKLTLVYSGAYLEAYSLAYREEKIRIKREAIIKEDEEEEIRKKAPKPAESVQILSDTESKYMTL